MQTKARLKNPVLILPKALEALLEVNKAAENDGLPYSTCKLIHLRASQINGCGVCVDMHARELKKTGESDERIFAVAAWRGTPYFNETERSVLALTEAVTRINDRVNPVPDDIWNEVARHFDETALAGLVVQIGLINLWNRLNIATAQVVEPV